MRHPGVTRARLEETSKNGQKPFVAVLGCADSRVPVETIFDRGIGDIFTVRVAGNVVTDPSITGSLEYVVEHLHVPVIVVLAHTQCGAVAATASEAKITGGLVDIRDQIEPAVREVKAKYPDLQGEAFIDAAAQQNAYNVKQNLLAGSEEIRELVKEGKLSIVPAIYNIRTGQVEWLSEKE